MTRPKITPGPWKVKKTYQGALTDRFKDFPFAVAGEGFRPCLIYGDGTANRGLAKAHAKAIAALPACLLALEKLSTCGFDSVEKIACAALADAGYIL